jgi:hypothetical protein
VWREFRGEVKRQERDKDKKNVEENKSPSARAFFFLELNYRGWVGISGGGRPCEQVRRKVITEGVGTMMIKEKRESSKMGKGWEKIKTMKAARRRRIPLPYLFYIHIYVHWLLPSRLFIDHSVLW